MELRPAVVPGYLNFPNTLVREDGAIFSRARNWGQKVGHLRERAPAVCKSSGYLRLQLGFRKQKKMVCVHRLVALVFLGPPPFPNAEVRHKDGTGMHGRLSNNHVDNLAWATAKQNSADRSTHGTIKIGQDHHRANISDEKAAKIWEAIKGGMGNTEIASSLGTTYDTVSKIRSGKTWKHLTSPQAATLQAGESSI